jgi:hypothetical protein
MSDWSYGWVTRILKRIGFHTLAQLDECIEGYDDDKISKAIWGSRQGQIQRLEDVLIIAMADGDALRRHPWASNADWFEKFVERRRVAAKQMGITPGNYDPLVVGSPAAPAAEPLT